MKNNLNMNFTVDKESNKILIQREFDADREQVWAAFTDAEILDKWWAPKPWVARTKRMDFREGGQWLYAMIGPNNEEHWALANYTFINPKKQYKGSDGFSDSEGVINLQMPQSKWNVQFESDLQRTNVTFEIEYENLEQLETTIKMGFKEGISFAMEGLDSIFEARQAAL